MQRLTSDQTSYLLTRPETGMGFQAVEARISGLQQMAIVFNAELLMELWEVAGVVESSYDELVDRLEVPPSVSAEILEVLSRPEQPTGQESLVAEGPPALPSTHVLRRSTTHSDKFQRFSAFRRDRRITSGGGLRAGTYTTSLNDGRMAPSGFAAVGRYALPNPWPAVFVFDIVPGAGIRIGCGTVTPAFGQAGGGVEALFVDPSPPGTVSGPSTILDI